MFCAVFIGCYGNFGAVFSRKDFRTCHGRGDSIHDFILEIEDVTVLQGIGDFQDEPVTLIVGQEEVLVSFAGKASGRRGHPVEFECQPGGFGF